MRLTNDIRRVLEDAMSEIQSDVLRNKIYNILNEPPRSQKILLLFTDTVNIESGVLGKILMDPNINEPYNIKCPEYNCVIEALRDGWELLSLSQQTVEISTTTEWVWVLNKS